MHKTITLLAILSVTLAACDNADKRNAIIGGVAGAVIADSTGGDALGGAAAGAAAGALCDDFGICH